MWVVGGPQEKEIAAEIVQSDPTHIRDLTGPDLRNAILAIAAAEAVLLSAGAATGAVSAAVGALLELAET